MLRAQQRAAPFVPWGPAAVVSSAEPGPVAEVVASVIAGAELLKQAKADPRRFDLAASWINRQMLDVESKTQRIQEGSSARIDRCEKIIDLVDV